MIKFRFDEEKKKRFLEFWKIEDISDFEKLDDVDFAFTLSKLYSHGSNANNAKGVVFSKLEVLIAHCLKAKLLQIKNDRLSFSESVSFSNPFQGGDEILQLLDDVNIISKFLDRKQLHAESKDKISFSKRMTDFLSGHPLLQSAGKRGDHTINANDLLKITPSVKKISKARKEVSALYEMLTSYQGVAFCSLDREHYQEAARELVKSGVCEIVLVGLGCLPALLLKGEQKKDEADDEEAEQKILLANSYLKRRFCKNLLSVELFFYQKHMPSQLACKFLTKSEERQKAFLQREVFPQFEKLILKNDLEQKLLPAPKDIAKSILKKIKSEESDAALGGFEKKVYFYVVAGMANAVSIFFELVHWLAAISKVPPDLDQICTHPLTEEELFSSINRHRFFQGRRPFAWPYFRKGFALLKRLGLVSIVSNRLVFLSPVFAVDSMPPASGEHGKKAGEKSKKKSSEKSRITIDSDMTMLAFAKEISLADIYFFSLFCSTNYTEYTIKFTPNPIYASFAWCSGLNGNKVVEKFKHTAGETFNEKVEHYFLLYFEHAKVARLDKLSVVFFSSQNFFLAVKHAVVQFLKGHPDEKENLFILEEKRGFLFLKKSTKKIVLQFLMEREFLKGSQSKNKLEKP